MHTRPLKIAEKERRYILPAHLVLFYSLGSGVGAIASTGIYTLATARRTYDAKAYSEVVWS